MSAWRTTDGLPAPPARGLSVRLPDGRILRFSRTFLIGRDHDCEVRIDEEEVSRQHAEVSCDPDGWLIRDLKSRNGLFVADERVEDASIGDGLTVALGEDGPVLEIDPDPPVRNARGRGANDSDEDALLDGYAARYFDETSDEEVGGHTRIIRKAFRRVRDEQMRRHRQTIAVVALVALAASGFAYYEYRRAAALEAAARQDFYTMKELDVTIADTEEAGGEPDRTALATYTEKRQSLARSYDERVRRLYDRGLKEEERLILQVTRALGECEIAAPPRYVQEVMRYIDQWRSTNRLANAVRIAQQRGYTRRIVSELAQHDLPPYFFYLALQESGFDPDAIGSPTRFGFAKGMWQFIPDTGREYHLALGPRWQLPGKDPEDERFDWEKATRAAARYIKYIYTTDAQASGLLVMASYNYGETRIIDTVRQMPDNPRERNFWKLLARRRLPDQTYNYVFAIVAAAVIGENPRLFGFDFDNPLKDLTPTRSLR
jgi:membrane-bound lytic murein transglycosylase D